MQVSNAPPGQSLCREARRTQAGRSKVLLLTVLTLQNRSMALTVLQNSMHGRKVWETNVEINGELNSLAFHR